MRTVVTVAITLLMLVSTAVSQRTGQDPFILPPHVAKDLLRTQVSPEYPPLARQAGIKGMVELYVVVGPDGLVRDVRLISGHPLLNPAAIKAVQQWTYRPFLNGGTTPLAFATHVAVGVPPSVLQEGQPRSEVSSDAKEPTAPASTPDVASGFRAYNNARFGYSVSYPPTLFNALPEADNGDGRRFEATSGTAEMAVWGSHSDNLDDLYRSTSSNARKVTYSVKRPNWFVVSGFTQDGTVFYQKTIVQDGAARSVRIEYPVAERAKYDAVVPKIAGSLRRMGPPL